MWLPLGCGPLRWSLYSDWLRSKSHDFLRIKSNHVVTGGKGCNIRLFFIGKETVNSG